MYFTISVNVMPSNLHIFVGLTKVVTANNYTTQRMRDKQTQLQNDKTTYKKISEK